jgi:hypothetical protein
LPDHAILHHFHLGLSKEAALHLDISSGGSFSHKTISEEKAILEKILKNTQAILAPIIQTPPIMAFFMSFPKKKSSQAPTNKRRHKQSNPKSH